uniref:DUF6598 domain-containing protein n=1 Tax=Leersia perrieri TaxID=77586 RepID=A0A0D9X491_9ORYZ
MQAFATRIPPMRFTHDPVVDFSARATPTLHIFSVKVAATRGDLQWPIHVFGIVSMRDILDRNRNIFRLGYVVWSVEATIFVRVIDGSWPEDFRGQFAAFTTCFCCKDAAREDEATNIDDERILLLDSGGEKVVVTADGKIMLSRHVVSAERGGELKVSVRVWKDGNNVVETLVVFTALEAGLSDAKIPPMRYTFKPDVDYYTARAETTLQIFSVKRQVEAYSGRLMCLVWFQFETLLTTLFHRERDNCQTLTEEFRFGYIVSSVEATISVQVIHGSWPDGFRGEFSAFATGFAWKDSGRKDDADHEKILLLDSVGEKVTVTGDGKIDLSRCVVSVENKGELKVSVKAWEVNKNVVETEMVFTALESGLSHGTLEIGFCMLKVTVAWSLISCKP